MQKSYRLDPKQLGKQKRNIILIYGISGLIAGITMFLSQRAQGVDRKPWLIIVLVIILLAYFGYRSYRQRVELWDGYRLTLDEQGLTLSQPGYPDSSLPLGKITSVEEGREGLWISTQQGKRVFIVPVLLSTEDYDEVCGVVRQSVKAIVNPEEKESEQKPEAKDTAMKASVHHKHAVPSEAEGLDDL